MSNSNLNYVQIKSHHDNSLFMNRSSTQSSLVKNTYDIELKRIWSYFMKSFELDEFYEDVSFNGKAKLSNPERIKAIKMLNDFFIKYKISYSDNFGLICADQNLLKEEKIWIMYIIIMGQTLEIADVLEIFKNSIKNGIDAVILFEFFLIFISKYNSECFQSLLLYNENIFPEEFLEIYKDNIKQLSSIFGIQHDCTNDNILQSNCEFSFHTRDEDTDIKIDLEGVRLDNTRNTEYEEDKSLSDKIIDRNALEQDNCLMTEILQDELINDTILNDKSPAVLGRYQCRNLDMNKMFADTSPTLDSYLVPNVGSLDKNISNCNTEDKHVEAYKNYEDNLNLNPNLNNLVVKIDFGTDGEGQDISDSNEGDDNDYEMAEECDGESEFNYHEGSNICIDEQNQNYSQEPIEQFNVEDYYNDDNLFLIDSNFKNKDHFAIFILIGKLKERFSEGDNVLYVITPIKNSFDDEIYEKMDVQKDLDDIRASNYSNFIYFPYNPKLIELIKYSELM